MTKENTMNFEQFKNEVTANILTHLPEKYSGCKVETLKVLKNNMELTALNIINPETNITPSIYLENFYEKYKSGKSMDEILDEIADIRKKSEIDGFDVSFVLDWEKAKDLVLPKLIKAETNREFLEKTPYKELCDLAIIYMIPVVHPKFGSGTINIKNSIFDSWNKTLDEVHEAAIGNMKKQEPYFKNIFTLAEECTGETYDLESDEVQPYIVSNKEIHFGASMILNDDLMQEVSEKFGKTFLIIPSSIHEVLIFPEDIMPIEAVKLMVHEVNMFEVAPQERLSDTIYRYNAEDKKISEVA